MDSEALTPNLLALIVEGGGIVVVLLQSVSSLKQLYTMSMVGSHAVIISHLNAALGSQNIFFFGGYKKGHYCSTNMYEQMMGLACR